jgi:hypothetical protein
LGTIETADEKIRGIDFHSLYLTKYNEIGFVGGMDSLRCTVILLTVLVFMARGAWGEPIDPKADSSVQGNIPATTNADLGVIGNWLREVSAIQAEQPHWATPVATVTPRLEQEFRYDQFWQSAPQGRITNNYGGGKGFEFIPVENIEVIVGVPAYETRDRPAGTGGFSDENLLVKYRILSGNEEHGDYILTGFLGVSLPVGSDYNTAMHEITTPTIAYGKGWGDFDIQTTLGIAVPDDGAPRNQIGTPVASNTTFQYHLFTYLWPEVELNYTWYPNGEHEGLNQLFVTPGLVIGRFKIHDRIGFTIGAGTQIAVTDTPTYNRNIILTARFPF